MFKIVEELPGLNTALARETEIIGIACDCKFQLYNETAGGEGGGSYEWTDEQRKLASKRMTGPGNPMYGIKLFGPENGNFGKKMKSHVKEILLKHRCKLTAQQVEEIRTLYSNKKYTQTELAKIFNISLTQIHRIITGQKWNNGMPSDHKIKPNIKPEQVLQMRELYNTGKYTQAELGKQFNLSSSQIHRIINKKRWKSI